MRSVTGSRGPRWWIKPLAILLALALSLGVAACGGSSGSTSSSSSTTSEPSGEETASGGGGEGGSSLLIDAPPSNVDLAAPKPFEKYCSKTLSMEEAVDFKVPKAKESGQALTQMLTTLQGEYFISAAWGFQEAAKEAGVAGTTLAAEGYASPEVQQQQFGDLSQGNTKGVVILPSDVNGSVPLVAQAKSAGIQLSVAGSLLNSNEVPQAVQSDFALGEQAADLVAKALKEEGKSGGAGLIMAGPKQATWASNRLAGFEARIAEKYPEIEIAVATNQNFVDPTEGLNTFTDATQAHPEIQWIYSVDYNLLEAQGLPSTYKGKIPYIAMGLYGTSREALEEGTVNAVIGLMPALGARIGVANAVSMLNGEKVPAITCYPAPVYTAEKLNQPTVKWEGYPAGFKP
ncbi:MAG: sugar ABC transporter substrate-binding protein [Actinobacteria bacterium]|nr:sugar ABC transporter substrate-binding protein [Actinomycetota bacterium]